MIVVAEHAEGYFIKSEDETLAFISFSVALPTEWKARLVDEFKDLLIKRLNLEPPPGTEATCKMCNQPIRYIGPYWEHLGELQPRHPAWPKEG